MTSSSLRLQALLPAGGMHAAFRIAVRGGHTSLLCIARPLSIARGHSGVRLPRLHTLLAARCTAECDTQAAPARPHCVFMDPMYATDASLRSSAARDEGMLEARSSAAQRKEMVIARCACDTGAPTVSLI